MSTGSDVLFQAQSSAGGRPGDDSSAPSGRAARRRYLVWWWLRQPGLILSVIYLALVVAWALLPGVFATHDPIADLDSAHPLSGPNSDHWFGTDPLGRDIYSRVVYGARLSLFAAVLATAISLVGGVLLGMIAGYFGRAWDAVISRTVDVLVAIPSLLLAMAVVSMLGFGVTNVAVAVGIAGIPSFARITRAETIAITSRAYLEASVVTGRSTWGILFGRVLPNASGAVLVLTALELGGAVLSVSALSFLGFGAVPPTPEWGAMVTEGRVHIASAWWMTTFPGVAISLLVLSANRISRSLRVRQS